MLEILYYVFIFPIEQVLDWILFTLFKIVKSYGISIVLLSFLLQFFMLKLSLYFDKKSLFINSLKKQCDDKIVEFKRVFKGAELQSYIRTLYKQKHFHPIFTIFGLGGLILQIPFFIAMIYLVNNETSLQNASFFWISDLSKPDSVFLFDFDIHILPLLMTIFTLINVFISKGDKNSKMQGILITLLFFVLLYNMPSALVLFWTCNMIFSLIKEIYKKFRFQNIDFLNHNFKEANSNTYKYTTIFAILNICFACIIFSPYIAFSSDVTQFASNSIYQILAGLFGFFLFSIFFVIYIFSFFHKMIILKCTSYLFSFLLFFGFICLFVFTGDYGSMDGFIFQKLSFADQTLRFQKYIQAFVSIFVALLLTFLLRKYLLSLFKFIFATQIIISCIYFSHIIFTLNDFKIENKNNYNDDILATEQYEKDSIGNLLSYSRDEKNIVVFVLDMFSGSHSKYILEQFPKLRDSLDGFVLFDNTLSTTDSTIHSISTLIGGEYYSTYNMNSRANDLVDSIHQAYGKMGLNFANAGYDVNFSLFAVPNRDIKPILKYADNKINIVYKHPLFMNYYLKKQGILDNIKNNRKVDIRNNIGKFINFGLFKISPELYFRGKIYNSGFWLIGNDYPQQHIISSSYASSFYGFTHLNVIDSKKPTFKFLHSLMTHMPYGTYFHNNSCVFFSDKTAWDNNNFDVKMKYLHSSDKQAYYQHYDTEACALHYLSSYIKWLKENDIYDNTQIFVVSDHGGNDSINIPIDINRSDALFMFKDFKAKGKVKFDSRLMSNYDIVSIFCDNIQNGCQNVPKNILKNYPENRSIIFTKPSSWRLEDHKSNQWILDNIYKVNGNIHNKSSWIEITQEVKDGLLKIDNTQH